MLSILLLKHKFNFKLVKTIDQKGTSVVY